MALSNYQNPQETSCGKGKNAGASEREKALGDFGKAADFEQL